MRINIDWKCYFAVLGVRLCLAIPVFAFAWSATKGNTDYSDPLMYKLILLSLFITAPAFSSISKIFAPLVSSVSGAMLTLLLAGVLELLITIPLATAVTRLLRRKNKPDEAAQ